MKDDSVWTVTAPATDRLTKGCRIHRHIWIKDYY